MSSYLFKIINKAKRTIFVAVISGMFGSHSIVDLGQFWKTKLFFSELHQSCISGFRFVLIQLRQYQEGHINWFYTKNNSLTIIGGHLGFWQLWLYVFYFRIYHSFCHPQKHMYRGIFCVSLIIRSWDKNFFFFFLGGGGGGALVFMRGNFSSYILQVSKSVPCVHFIWMQIYRR